MASAPGDLRMIGALDTGGYPISRRTREVISEKLLE